GFQIRNSCSVTTTAFANAPAKTTNSTGICSDGAISRVAMYTTSAAAIVTKLPSLSARLEEVNVVTMHQIAIAARSHHSRRGTVLRVSRQRACDAVAANAPVSASATAS